MILLIDIGNSYLKTAFFDSKQDVFSQEWQSQRFALNAQGDSHWEQWLIPQLQQATFIVFSNVAKSSYETSLLAQAKIINKPCFKIITQAKAFNLTNGYRNPEQLGVDRWLTLVAARQHYNQSEALLIIDIGTAITLDLIDEQGEHLGGWIAPGYHLMTQSIFNYAAQIAPASQSVTSTDLSFGDNTQMGLHHGCIAALVGFIDHGVSEAERLLLERELSNNQSSTIRPSPKLILLGGGIRHLPKTLLDRSIINQNLIFEGLALYALQKIASTSKNLIGDDNG